MPIARRTLLLTACAALIAPAVGVAADVDFAGKRIEWIVPFNEGGGTDVFTRFMAPRLGKHLPGQPTIVIRNMPGGGSILAANNFAANAKPDGLNVFSTGGSTVMPYLMGDPRVEYEYRDWIPVFAQSSDAVVYTQASMGLSGPQDIAKLRGKELVFGSQGVSSLDLVALYGFKLLDLNVRPVFGMTGGGQKRLAFERGETTIDMQTAPAFIDHVLPLIQDKKAVPLWAWGALDGNGDLVRDPTFPDIPHFGEAYEAMHGKAPSGKEFDIIKALIAAGYGAEKFVFLPKGTPQPIVAAWRRAAAAAFAAPDFKSEVQKVLGTYPQIIEPRIDQVLLIATSLDADARAGVIKWLSESYNYKP